MLEADRIVAGGILFNDIKIYILSKLKFDFKNFKINFN